MRDEYNLKKSQKFNYFFFSRFTVLCKKENQKNLRIHKRNWKSNNALLWEEWFMGCKTWCCFIWTECCCKNACFSMDTLIRPNGGQTLCLTMTTQLSFLLSFVLLLLRVILIDWRMLSSSSSSSTILFFFPCLPFINHLCYVFSTELLYVDWRHIWSQNAPQTTLRSGSAY